MSAFSRLASVNVPTGARESIEVAVSSIDELLAAGEVPVPDVVKIDVEGAELEVIEGMRRTLDEHHPVLLCEVHDCNAEYVRADDGASAMRPSTSTPTCPSRRVAATPTRSPAHGRAGRLAVRPPRAAPAARRPAAG